MKILKLLFISLLYPAVVFAHGPTPQKAYEKVTINASVDRVWDAIKQFDALSSWHPEVKASSGDGKNAADGTRVITLHNDEQLTESLDYYSDKDHEYNFRLKHENVKALPVSSYTNNIQVTAGETPNTSIVAVKSRFYRGDTTNTPAENQNDAAAVKAMTDFFQKGLAGLKAKAEK